MLVKNPRLIISWLWRSCVQGAGQMHRERYQTGERRYLLWKTDETGRDVADVIAISSGPSPSPGHRGIAEWKLGACKLTRASEAGGVGLTSVSRAHLHGVIMHGHAAGNEYQVWGTIKAKRHLWELHYRGEMLDVLTNQSTTSLCHRQGEAASTRVDSQSKLSCWLPLMMDGRLKDPPATRKQLFGTQNHSLTSKYEGGEFSQLLFLCVRWGKIKHWFKIASFLELALPNVCKLWSMKSRLWAVCCYSLLLKPWQH